MSNNPTWDSKTDTDRKILLSKINHLISKDENALVAIEAMIHTAELAGIFDDVKYSNAVIYDPKY
jgi:hypothetical protein